MKVITFFVIQCVVSVRSQWASSHGMNACVGQMDGIVFPNPENCDAFVQCRRGAVTHQQCQSGTSFDLGLYYCVPSHTIDCGHRRTNNSPVLPPHLNDSPPTPNEHHSVCRNVRNGALIANPKNCRAYIECQQNLRLDRECSIGELFDASSGACLSDFAVDCGNRKISSSNDAVIRNVCGNQPNGIRVADPRDCRRYFVCFNQQGVEEECREGEMFESYTRRCVNGASVNCNGRPNGRENIAPPRITVDGEVPATICNSLPTGSRMSNPSECTRYYECRNNQRLDMQCPPSQAFDTALNLCRTASLVNCGNRGSTNRNPQTTPACFGQPNGRRMTNPNNCRAFFECQRNAEIDRTCDDGNLFDSQMATCLPANVVRCGSRRIPPTDGDDQEAGDFFPPCPRSGVIFRHHPHDCSKYFICADGNLIQHSCSVGILFNPDTMKCDLPQNVQCRLSRIVVPQTPILPDCSSGANFFPNLVDCKKYFKCVNNLPHLMDCPNGHLWNNMQLKCEKSDSEICARGFDSFKGRFIYTKPSDSEMRA